MDVDVANETRVQEREDVGKEARRGVKKQLLSPKPLSWHETIIRVL